MSTDYGFFCLDCRDALLIDDLRRPDDIVKVIAYAPRLAALRDSMPDVNLEVRVGYGEHRLDLSWFERHGTHALDVIDEYGARHPRCDARFRREGEERERAHPTFQRYCYEKAGHEGEHEDRGVFAKGAQR